MRWFTGLIFLLTQYCYAQDLPIRIEEKGELIASEGEEESDEEWRVAMQDFLRKKLNLNTAGLPELRSLQILNELQIQSFISYRENLGELVSIYELQAIPGWDLILIQKLLPFIRVGPFEKGITNLKNLIKGSNALFSFRILKKELTTNNVEGSSEGILMRYRLQYGNQFYAGILVEKDGGEPLLNSGLPDFSSFHFYMKGKGKLRALAIGDYRLRLGQGLLLTSRSFQSDVIGIREGGEILTSYRSAGETDFFRGGAAIISIGPFEFIPFFSYRKHSVTREGEGFSSFRRTGLHRTPSERSNRNNLGNISGGASIRFQKRGWELGFNFISHKLSLPKIFSSEPYRAFEARGSSFRHFSIDWGKAFSKLYFFGELASGLSGKPALILGIMTSLHPKADLALRFETISTGFQNPFSPKRGGSSHFYLGWLFRVKRHWQFSLSADLIHNAWLSFQKPGPHTGGTLVLRSDLSPDKKTDIIVQYRYKKEALSARFMGMKGLEERETQGLRIQFRKEINDFLTLGGRAEKAERGSSSGLMSSMEARIKWKRLLLIAEGALFNTDDFGSAFFSTGPSFLYGSNGSNTLFNRGARLVFLLRRQVKKGILLEGRACFQSGRTPEIGFQAVLEWDRKGYESRNSE